MNKLLIILILRGLYAALVRLKNYLLFEVANGKMLWSAEEKVSTLISHIKLVKGGKQANSLPDLTLHLHPH